MTQENLEALEAMEAEIHDLSNHKMTNMPEKKLAEHLFYMSYLINRVLRLMIIEKTEGDEKHD